MWTEFAAALLAALQAPPAILPPPPQPLARIADLAWLQGRWRTEMQRTPRCPQRWTEEIWTDPAAGIMFGASRTACMSILTEFEQLRIMSGNDGRLYLIATPNGAGTTQFSLAAIAPQSATFINENHDYPQRIRYWREGRVLHAETALKDGSKPRRWRYNRIGN